MNQPWALMLIALACGSTLVRAHGGCPYARRLQAAVAAPAPAAAAPTAPEPQWEGVGPSFSLAAFLAVNFTLVKADILTVLKTSQPFWPADFGNYGPFFIRMAWHCAGTYRASDGRGGCDGGSQRFDPPRSWADNANLDKARALLQPIKIKYGPGLSWGDLIIFAGTTAIEAMGGPVLGFCGGRIDDVDGAPVLALGPSAEQEAVAPCALDGNCTAPLGDTTLGLIYVNPEGPQGQPNLVGSFPQIRDTFARMGMNDSETVALIGAHAFGKTHGACPAGPGPAPNQQPSNPWPGLCGTGASAGKGANAFTSGFEGPWTLTPTAWGNAYFQNLLNFNWTVHVGPGGRHQWAPHPLTPTSSVAVPPIIMLTTDVSLTKDPSYLKLVQSYAASLPTLNNAFSHAWYKLVSRDMGPVSRCLGKNVPPAQPFQNPLPPPPSPLPNWALVRAAIVTALNAPSTALAPDVIVGGSAHYYGAVIATLAWQSISTFRATDYLGGGNGARIRFPPESTWPQNAFLNNALQVLAPIKVQFGAGLSYADLIVFAGQTAIEVAGGITLKFCPGRSDALDGSGSVFLAPRTYSDVITKVRDNAAVAGLTDQETVVLRGGLRSPAQQVRLGYSGSWTAAPATLSNAFFTTLLTQTWVNQTSPKGLPELKASGAALYLTPEDLVLRWDPAYLAIAQEYASNNALFLSDYAAAWTKVANADRFSGPTGSVCP